MNPTSVIFITLVVLCAQLRGNPIDNEALIEQINKIDEMAQTEQPQVVTEVAVVSEAAITVVEVIEPEPVPAAETHIVETVVVEASTEAPHPVPEVIVVTEAPPAVDVKLTEQPPQAPAAQPPVHNVQSDMGPVVNNDHKASVKSLANLFKNNNSSTLACLVLCFALHRLVF
jgi:hypothetical protein